MWMMRERLERLKPTRQHTRAECNGVEKIDSIPKWQPIYEWGKGKATTQASFGNLTMNLKGLATGIQREREPGM